VEKSTYTPSVDDIVRFEQGEMSYDETVEFLTKLRDAGLLSQLQGFYGRAARHFGLI